MTAIAAQPIPAHRLTLVPLRAEHADEMTAVLADPELYAFTGGSAPTRQELHARYRLWTAGSPDAAVSWCNWVIQLRSTQCLAGTVQATVRTVIAYIHPRHQASATVAAAAGLCPTDHWQDGEIRWTSGQWADAHAGGFQ